MEEHLHMCSTTERDRSRSINSTLEINQDLDLLADLGVYEQLVHSMGGSANFDHLRNDSQYVPFSRSDSMLADI